MRGRNGGEGQRSLVEGDWVIHDVLYTSSIAFHIVVVLLPYYCCCSIKQDVVGVGCKCTMQLR